MIRTVVFVLAFLTAFAHGSAAGRQTLDDPIERFRSELRADVEADGIGSIAAAVIIDTTVVWTEAFGWADRDRRTAADTNTIYRVGSITKSVTAVILMHLVERGVVALDDPVVKHLPVFEHLGGGVPEAGTITLRQLASHTGGLIREPELENAAAGLIGDWEDKIIASIPTTTLRSAPGTEYSYSNIGYGILGLALSRAAGESFLSLVERVFFRPLHMTSSTFIIEQPLDAHLAAGYVNGRDGSVDADAPAREHAGRGYKVPNGGIYSTAPDLARFAALMTGALATEALSERSRTEMLRRQTPGEGPQGYGLGFFLRTDDAGSQYAYHTGSVAGYTAALLFDPERRIGVVLLRNYARGGTNLLQAARQLAQELRTRSNREPETLSPRSPPAT